MRPYKTHALKHKSNRVTRAEPIVRAHIDKEEGKSTTKVGNLKKVLQDEIRTAKRKLRYWSRKERRNESYKIEKKEKTDRK